MLGCNWGWGGLVGEMQFFNSTQLKIIKLCMPFCLGMYLHRKSLLWFSIFYYSEHLTLANTSFTMHPHFPDNSEDAVMNIAKPWKCNLGSMLGSQFYAFFANFWSKKLALFLKNQCCNNIFAKAIFSTILGEKLKKYQDIGPTFFYFPVNLTAQ
jgi:hypothetical protein